MGIFGETAGPELFPLPMASILTLSAGVLVVGGLAMFMLTISGDEEQVREMVVEESDLIAGSIAVDVGAGTGFITVSLAEEVGDKGKVFAVDSHTVLLKVTLMNSKEKGIEQRVVAKESKADRLPLESNFADSVICNMFLHHTPNPERVLDEMVRVAKVGGRVVISDMVGHPPSPTRPGEKADAWPGFNVETVERWLKERGLVEVKVEKTPHWYIEHNRFNIFVAVGKKAA